jgi:putative ABC transport system substrate-binding protein
LGAGVGRLARPGGNATGVNFFTGEIATKRLELLHELVPAVTRIAVLVSPALAPHRPRRRTRSWPQARCD